MLTMEDRYDITMTDPMWGRFSDMFASKKALQSWIRWFASRGIKTKIINCAVRDAKCPWNAVLNDFGKEGYVLCLFRPWSYTKDNMNTKAARREHKIIEHYQGGTVFL